MKLLDRAATVFDKIIDYMLMAAAVIIVVDAVAVSEDVISRKFFGVTWNLLYELITYTLVWITFLGTAAILRAQGHVKMDTLTSRLPLKAQSLVNFVTSCACSILLVGIVYYTVKLTVYDYNTHFILASILNPLKWPIEVIIPVSFFMLLLQMIRNCYGFYKSYKAKPIGIQEGIEIQPAEEKTVF